MTAPHASRLAFGIRYLRPSKRALDACEALGVATVADFCARSRNDFLALPNFGERTWSDLSKRVEAFLDDSDAIPETAPGALDRPIADVLRNRRALRACRQLKIHTVGELLATPRQELLSVPGFGDRTLWDVHRQLGGTRPAEVLLDVLPEWLLQLPIEALPAAARARIDADGGTSLLELISDVPNEETRAALREGLNDVLRQPSTEEDADFPTWLRNVRQSMPAEVRRAFDRVVGVVRRPSTIGQTAIIQRVTQAELEALLDSARDHLRQLGGAPLARWATELESDRRALGGVVTPTTLAAGSSLRDATLAARDPALPLRVVAFCRPDVGFAHIDFVCRLDAAALHRLERALHERMRGDTHPIPLHRIRDSLDAGLLPPEDDALLVHVLRHRLHRMVRVHPTHGEVVCRQPRALPDRIEAILEAEGVPLRLDDLLFHYRDRHRTGRRSRLADALRSDGRFLQVSPDTWSIRSWHLDELELVRPEAERIADEICTYGVRRCARDPDAAPGSISERTAWLLVDHLRRNPRLRDLGRGEFCARRTDGAPLVAEIVRTLRHAMGEVPFARFLQNQPPGRRRLVSRLLRVNRLFVSPSRDRIDLAENFPYTGERLRMLLQAVRLRIDTAGYAALPQIREAVEEAGLGGAFLTEHLLLDILRRHGEFEILPGPIVADARLGLGQWIQRTTRQILRSHGDGMTPEQLLAERPELAEFAAALPELMELDPLVQSEDGLHYHLV